MSMSPTPWRRKRGRLSIGAGVTVKPSVSWIQCCCWIMESNTRMAMANSRVARAPRGAKLTCKNWLIEAPYRMIQNNLDPEVAERPEDLVVYGGRGQAA